MSSNVIMSTFIGDRPGSRPVVKKQITSHWLTPFFSLCLTALVFGQVKSSDRCVVRTLSAEWAWHTRLEYRKLPMIIVVLDVLSGESDSVSGNHKGMKE